jgi:hypothetical protein
MREVYWEEVKYDQNFLDRVWKLWSTMTSDIPSGLFSFRNPEMWSLTSKRYHLIEFSALGWKCPECDQHFVNGGVGDLRPDHTLDPNHPPYDHCPDCLGSEQCVIRLEPEDLVNCWFAWDREEEQVVNDVKHEDLKIRLMKSNQVIRATDYEKWANENIDRLNQDNGDEFDDWLTGLANSRTITWIKYPDVMLEKAGFRLGEYHVRGGDSISVMDDSGDVALFASLRLELDEVEVLLSTGEKVRITTDNRSPMAKLTENLRRKA